MSSGFDDYTLQTMSEAESTVLTIQEASSSSADITENSYDSSNVFINESTSTSGGKYSERDNEASWQGELIHYQTEEVSDSADTESESSWTTTSLEDEQDEGDEQISEEHVYESISSNRAEVRGDQVEAKRAEAREKKVSWIAKVIHEITSFRGGGLVRAYELGRML